MDSILVMQVRGGPGLVDTLPGKIRYFETIDKD